jgi:hypothetical protein
MTGWYGPVLQQAELQPTIELSTVTQQAQAFRALQDAVGVRFTQACLDRLSVPTAFFVESVVTPEDLEAADRGLFYPLVRFAVVICSPPDLTPIWVRAQVNALPDRAQIVRRVFAGVFPPDLTLNKPIDRAALIVGDLSLLLTRTRHIFGDASLLVVRARAIHAAQRTSWCMALTPRSCALILELAVLARGQLAEAELEARAVVSALHACRDFSSDGQAGASVLLGDILMALGRRMDAFACFKDARTSLNFQCVPRDRSHNRCSGQAGRQVRHRIYHRPLCRLWSPVAAGGVRPCVDCVRERSRCIRPHEPDCRHLFDDCFGLSLYNGDFVRL